MADRVTIIERGRQGPQGPQGAQGPQGLEGPEGPAGGGYETLAELNTDIADATLDDTNAPRIPKPHATSHAAAGDDTLTPADIGAATVAQGTKADNAVQPGNNVDTLGSGAATLGQAPLADGAGSVVWGDVGGGGSAAGADGEIQFALSGGFSADAGLAYNSTARALTVGGATVTADSPVLDLAQTWNAAGVTFTALKLNVTDTASAAASALLDLQIGGVSQEKTDKAGNKTLTGTIKTADGALNANAYGFGGETRVGLSRLGDYLLVQAGTSSAVAAFRYINGIGLQLRSDASFGWAPGEPAAAFNDLRLYRDAANILAQRNLTNPQTFRAYNSYTDASNLERLSIGWAANVCTIATEALGTGTKRNLVLDGANRAAYSETAADIAAALVAHGIMAPA